jgi:5-methyltetrahydropteroyltriglutamate--homocysteine methyltransferase
MFNASAGKMLPTSIIGSLPRPSWYTAALGAKSFLEAMVNARYREQYEDAVSVHLRAQETAGSTSALTAMPITTMKWAV